MPKDKYICKIYSINEAAYMAGIVDGEGSLTIGNYSANKKTGVPHYQTMLKISNTDFSLLDWVMNTFGGRYHAYSEKQTPKNSRQKYFYWIATGNRLTHILQTIYPYSIVKKEQIEIMLAIRATYQPHTSRGGIQGTQSLSQEIMDFRQECFHKLRNLHTRKGYHSRTK